MSSIFQDTTDIYADSTWEATPWRNYFRKPNKPISLSFPGDDVDYNLWCVEEQMVGYKISIDVTDTTTDKIGRIRLYKGADVLSSTTDSNTFAVGSTNQSAPAWRTDGAYSWFMPGIGFRFAQTVNATSTFTANRQDDYTFLESDLSDKVFDGGIHSWIKIDTASAGIGTAQYSKPIPSEFLRGEDFLLVFNSLSNKHSHGTGSNNALTMHLLGSVDGVNYDTLGEIFEDIDIKDTAMPGMSDTYQLTHLLVGLNYPKYKTFKFRWYTENGTGAERLPMKQNFVPLSLYKL